MNSFRLLTISLFLLMFTINANAQTLEFGLTGGINFSSHYKDFKYSVDDNTRMQLSPQISSSYQVGLMLRNVFSHSIRLQADPSLIFLGASYEEPFNIRGHELQTQSQTELLYLQLPLLLQISSSPSRYKEIAPSQIYGSKDATTTFHLSGGIFGGYLLDARFSGKNYGAPLGVSFEENFSNDVTSQFPQYDGGVLLGLGLEHGNNRKIGLETRALYSLFNSGNEQQLSSFEIQNYALTFSVYFLL